MNGALGLAYAHMADDGAEFLRQASLIQGGATLAFQVRGHGQDGAHRQHPGAAHARDQHIPGPRQLGPPRFRQVDKTLGPLRRRRLAQLAAYDGDKAGAEALHASVVLVAGALVDAAFASQGRLQGQHGQAVGLRAAIAAPLAHRLVDEHPPGWFRH